MYVYIIKSIGNPKQWYIGCTKDIHKRIIKHNNGEVPHTLKFRPWKLSVVTWFGEDKKAWDFEKYLKSGSGFEFRRRHF
jgi:predicted GIY-YIG superfamily endonuclease